MCLGLAGFTVPQQAAAQDPVTVTLSDGYGIEGQDVTFTVTLSRALPAVFLLTARNDLRNSGGGDGFASADDFTRSTGPGIVATISQGALTGTFTVATMQDDLVEGDEVFNVSLLRDITTVGGVTIEYMDTTNRTGTILDDDVERVTISNARATEGEDLEFEVNLSRSQRIGVMVPFEISNGTTTNADYRVVMINNFGERVVVAPHDYQLQIRRRATSVRLLVEAIDDSEDEGTETFTVRLREPSRNSSLPARFVVDPRSATGTILDNDEATPTGPVYVEVDDAGAEEGTAIDFTISLSRALPEDVTFTASTSLITPAGVDVAAATDFTALSNHSVTIAMGETTGTFTVATTADDAVEAHERFAVSVTGSAPSGETFDLSDATAMGRIRNDDEALISISPSRSQLNFRDAGITGYADEGEMMYFNITLDAPVYADVVLGYITVEGKEESISDELSGRVVVRTGAEAPEDYTAANVIEVRFAAGTMGEREIAIQTTDDSANPFLEVTYETFEVQLTVPSEGLPTGVRLASERIIGTIGDDETATISFNMDSATESAVEGGELNFTLDLVGTRGEGVPVPLVVGWNVEGSGDAQASASDFPMVSGTAAFDAFTTETTFTIATTVDQIVELDETFTVTLTRPAGTRGTVDMDAGTATGTILDRDRSRVTLTGTPTEAEGDSLTFTVNLTGELGEALELTWTATSGTATVEDDLVESMGTVTVDAGETMATFDVQAATDDRVEPDETFTVSLAFSDTVPEELLEDPNAQGAGGVRLGLGEAIIATGTITNTGGFALVSLEAITESVEEGEDMRLRVVLDAAVSQDTTVLYRFLTEEGNVTVARDTTSTEFTVATLDDDQVELNEVATVTIAEGLVNLPSNVRLDTANDRVQVRLTNNDSLEISIAPAADVEEGDPTSTALVFEVALNGAFPQALTVNWEAEGFGTSPATLMGANSDLASMQETSGMVTFQANEMTKEITLAVKDDDVVEENETVRVRIMGDNLPPEVTVRSGAASADGIINDMRDLAQVSIADMSVEEGETVMFTVTLSKAVSQGFSLNWAATSGTGSNTATVTGASSDLLSQQAATGEVRIAANSTTARFQIRTLDDDFYEEDETFEVRLSIPDDGAPRGVNFGSPVTNVAIVTIENNDQPEATVTMTTTASGNEGDQITFTLMLSRVREDNIHFRVSTELVTPAGRGAASTDDFVALNDRLVTISGGDLSQTFTVRTLEDTLLEGDETFDVTVTLGTGEGTDQSGRIIPSRIPPDITPMELTAVGTIVDDEEDDVVVSIVGTSAVEGDDLVFEVRLSGAVGEAIVVDWSAAGSGSNMATLSGANSDLAAGQAASGMVTIAEGSITQTITMGTLADSVSESAETLTVTIMVDDLPTGVSVSTSGEASALGTILPPGSTNIVFVSLEATTPSAAEGSDLAFRVTLDEAVLEAVNLRWTASADTSTDSNSAAPNIDLETFTDTLTIGPGATEATFTIRASEDDVVEVEDETFVVTITENGPLPGRAVTILTNAEGTITNTTTAEVTLSAENTPEREGRNLRFNATLNRRVSEAVTLRWTATADDSQGSNSATVATDLDAMTGTMSIGAGSTTASILIGASTDDVVEFDETFVVTLSPDTDNPLPENVSIPSSGSRAIGTIESRDSAEVTIAVPTGGETVVTEGEDAVFEVRLSNPVVTAVEAVWSLGTPEENPASSRDIVGDVGFGTVRFEPDSTAVQLITLTSEVDDEVEADESLQVVLRELRTLPAGVRDDVSIGSQDRATVAILSEDFAEVSIVATRGSTMEGSSFSFRVELSEPADRNVTLRWTARADTNTANNNSATVADDLSGESTGLLTLNAESTFTLFALLTAADELVEGDETLVVSIANESTPDVRVDQSASSVTVTILDDDSATLSLEAVTASAAEGDFLSFRVRLSQTVERAVNVPWTAMAGSGSNPATVADDLEVTSDTVSIAAGSTEETFRIRASEDGLVEGDETFEVSIAEDASLPGVTVSSSASSVTGTIEDEDGAILRLEGPATPVLEGGDLVFTVRLNGALREALTVQWAAAGSGANQATLRGASSDLAANVDISGEVIFPANSTMPQTISLATTTDNQVETDETFEVTISTSQSEVTIENSRATGTIRNNTRAAVSIANMTASEGAGNISFTARLSQVATSPVVLDIEYADGTADVATDLGSLLTTVTIAANTSEATFNVPIIDDLIVEGSENFTVTISSDTLPDGVSIPTGTATGTITDNDSAEVSLTATTASATEGEELAFTVTLSQTVSQAVNLRWTASADTSSGSNSATVADDLEAITDTVSVATGMTTATFMVDTSSDDVVEGDETFVVTLTAVGTLPPNVMISSSAGSVTGTIVDEDTANFSIVATTPMAAEGSDVVFEVRLSRALAEAVTVNWEAAGSGSAPNRATLSGEGSDLATNEPITGMVEFSANSTTAQRINVTTATDNLVEENETFEVTISVDMDDLPDGVVVSSADSATGTITSADTAEASIAATTPMAAEESNLVFTVTLSNPVSQAVSLNWTAMGSGSNPATVADDLTASTGSVPIAAGMTTATFNVGAAEDTLVEGDETFEVTITRPLGGLPDGVTVSSADSAVGTITSADTSQVSLAATTASAIEGGALAFTVTLSQAVSQAAVDLRWTATAGSGSNPATVAEDLEAITDTVSVATGMTMATFMIDTSSDDLVEGDETFVVTLTAVGTLPADVVISSSAASATGTIVDEDSSTVSVAATTATAAEGSDVVFEIRLSRALSRAVSVSWMAEGSGTNPATLSGEGSDLAANEAIMGTVMFMANSTTPQTVNLTTAMDDLVESAETFEVRIDESNLPSGLAASSASRATGTITSADTTTISLEASTDEVVEGSFLVFVLRLSKAVSDPVDVMWTAMMTSAESSMEGAMGAVGATEGPMGATTGEDLERMGTVTIPAGATMVTFMIETFADDEMELDEEFVVMIAPPTGGFPTGDITILAMANSASVTVRNRTESVLSEPRRTAAGSALRRHVNRFDSLMSTVVNARLHGRDIKQRSLSQDLKSGKLAAGGQLGKTRWGGWFDGAYAGFDGDSSGNQAEFHGGVDYVGDGGDWVIGGLLGMEFSDLDVGETRYRADFAHVGIYGGARITKNLMWGSAISYGLADPEVEQGATSARYDAERLTIRSELTGRLNIGNSGALTVEPQLGVIYARERLGSFIDSNRGVGMAETLELGRFKAGPRVTWRFDRGALTSTAQVNWDFDELEDGADSSVSGSLNLGLIYDLSAETQLDLSADIDGFGVDDFMTYGVKAQINGRF